MNTTTITNETSAFQTFSGKISSVASEAVFFVKTGVIMSAMILLLASAWI